jgi:predicted alpha/beta-fold hydrolase
VEYYFGYFYKQKPEKEIFELSDGGQIALEWFTYSDKSSTSPSSKDSSKNPILLLIPGLVGDSSVLYVVSTVKAALS